MIKIGVIAVLLLQFGQATASDLINQNACVKGSQGSMICIGDEVAFLPSLTYDRPGFRPQKLNPYYADTQYAAGIVKGIDGRNLRVRFYGNLTSDVLSPSTLVKIVNNCVGRLCPGGKYTTTFTYPYRYRSGPRLRPVEIVRIFENGEAAIRYLDNGEEITIPRVEYLADQHGEHNGANSLQ
jgi:hypothetical protein